MEGGVMSDQVKTFVAYIVGVSLLMLAWSVLKAWAPTVPMMRGAATETSHRAGVLPRIVRD
jgi:hypothetical protein